MSRAGDPGWEDGGRSITGDAGEDGGADADGGRADLADLQFTNLLIEVNRDGSLGQYAPSTGETIDQRLLPIPERFTADVLELRKALQGRTRAGGENRFTHDVGSLRLRATALHAESGELWVVLRRIPPQVPDLESLGIRAGVISELRRWLTMPGLSMVTGTFGTGKTWTGCAMLKDQVVRHGGLAISMESPTEYFMHGAMGEYGRCIQIPVDETADRTWEQVAANVRKASPTIIYVGEVSTPAIAKVVVALSTTGRPILTTCHGSGHADAIRTLASFAEEAGMPAARNTLSGSLVGVAHQTMVRGRPVVRLLSFDGPNGAATRIAVAEADAEGVDAEAMAQEEESMAGIEGETDLAGTRGTRG